MTNSSYLTVISTSTLFAVQFCEIMICEDLEQFMMLLCECPSMAERVYAGNATIGEVA